MSGSFFTFRKGTLEDQQVRVPGKVRKLVTVLGVSGIDQAPSARIRDFVGNCGWTVWHGAGSQPDILEGPRAYLKDLDRKSVPFRGDPLIIGGLEIPEERNLCNIAEIGNTTAGTIPSVLAMNIDNGKIQRGDKLVFTAFGGGLTSGSLLMTY